jgi:hypothetical protein
MLGDIELVTKQIKPPNYACFATFCSRTRSHHLGSQAKCPNGSRLRFIANLLETLDHLQKYEDAQNRRVRCHAEPHVAYPL